MPYKLDPAISNIKGASPQDWPSCPDQNIGLRMNFHCYRNRSCLKTHGYFFFLQLDRAVLKVSRFSDPLWCILNSAELLHLWWPCDIDVLHCKGLRRDLVSPKVDCARFQCAGFCCGCRNEELKLWGQRHTTVAMAFCADHACAGHKRPTSRPSGCVGPHWPAPANLPA